MVLKRVGKIMGFLFSITTEKGKSGTLSPLISLPFQEFDDILETKRGCPLPGHSHQVPLLLNVKPDNLVGYRYPHIQTNVIESMVSEMMNQGINKASYTLLRHL